jgi:hypothetical protein
MVGTVCARYGLIHAGGLHVTFDLLCDIAQESDIHRLDRELDHLRAMALSESGILPGEASHRATLTPSALALHMYVRCQGSRISLIEFFNASGPSARLKARQL